MKTPLWIGICVVLLASIGCRSTPEKAATATPTVRSLTPPSPPITANMITEANWRQMFQRIEEEINVDAQGEW